MKFNNKIAIISGAANGIGKKVAHDLYAEGAKIVVCDIQADKLNEIYGSLDAEKVMIFKLDVTQSSQWEELRNRVEQKFQRVDFLLNIAGIIEPNYIHQTSVQKIDRQIDINLKGSIYGSHYFSEIMVEAKSGHIVNISSMAGIAAVPGLNIYSATKFGIRGFSLAIAQELMEYGVRVSVVCPDAVQTGMLDYQKDKKEAALTFSGNKFLTVEDLSRCILSLLEKPKMEVWLPKSRGILSTISVLFPKLATKLKGSLIKKGMKKQSEY